MTSKNNQELRKYFAQVLKERPETQKKLGEILGVKQSEISRFIQAERLLSTDRIVQLLKILGIESTLQLDDQTFSLTEENNPPPSRTRSDEENKT
ncbi:MAG: helix-turn-helix transcriptional regulator [Thiotrichaceae bacterium]|nr:helix-turn-helix transcriptional regulator [Thiotrichaceae bacterium]